jgi:hypothetical protein
MSAPAIGARRVLALGALAVAFGCSEDTPVATGIVRPTLVTVPPDAFLGGVPCLDAPGAMRSYVATLRHLGPPPEPGAAGETGSSGGDEGAPGGGAGEGGAPGLTLEATATAPPLACTKAAGFGAVTPNHRYLADVYAFDRTGLGLQATPEGSAPPEVPVVVDLETGARVLPRWTTRCRAVTARYAVIRPVKDCDPLTDHLPSVATTVRIDLDAALAGAECGPLAGEIERFEIATPSGTVTIAHLPAAADGPRSGARHRASPICRAGSRSSPAC